MGDPAADTAEPPTLRGGAKGFATMVTAPACQLGPTALGSGSLAGLIVSLGLAPPADRHLLARYPMVTAGTGPEGLITHITLVLELRRRLELDDGSAPDPAVLQHDNARADALRVEKAIQVESHVTVLSSRSVARQVSLRRAWGRILRFSRKDRPDEARRSQESIDRESKLPANLFPRLAPHHGIIQVLDDLRDQIPELGQGLQTVGPEHPGKPLGLDQGLRAIIRN